MGLMILSRAGQYMVGLVTFLDFVVQDFLVAFGPMPRSDLENSSYLTEHKTLKSCDVLPNRLLHSKLELPIHSYFADLIENQACGQKWDCGLQKQTLFDPEPNLNGQSGRRQTVGYVPVQFFLKLILYVWVFWLHACSPGTCSLGRGQKKESNSWQWGVDSCMSLLGL